MRGSKTVKFDEGAAKRFGALFRAERRRAGLRQKHIATLLYTSTGYVCDVENGRRPPFLDGDLREVLDALQPDAKTRLDMLTLAAIARGTIDVGALDEEQVRKAVRQVDKIRYKLRRLGGA